MHLYKKLAIALLCSSLSYPFCVTMDQETIETRALREHHENALRALKLIQDSHLSKIDQNSFSYLNETKRLLNLEAEKTISPR